MNNSLLITPMTTPLSFTLTSFPRLPKSTPSTQPRWKLVKLSLKNISEWDKLYSWNSPKPLPSFLYQRRMEPYTHARTITTWTPTLSEMPTHFPSSLNSSMTWRNPPCSPNLTFTGNTITSTFEKKTNGRRPSSLPWDYSNLLSCSLDFAPPPHIPSIHESYLHEYAEGEMAENLHGWPWNPH